MFIEGTSIVLFAYFLFLKVSSNSAFPKPLSSQDEENYFRLAKKGDLEARNVLIERNLRLVAHIAKKYTTQENDSEDLISIGTIGLIKAIDSFDPECGTRFATYAGKCLQNEILMYLRSRKKLSCETLLSDAVDVDKDGNPLTYMDILSSDEDIFEKIDIKINSAKAIKAVNTVLDEREREIIILRYGLGGISPMTQKEIAKLLKISRSYVSRIEKGALEKLRAQF